MCRPSGVRGSAKSCGPKPTRDLCAHNIQKIIRGDCSNPVARSFEKAPALFATSHHVGDLLVGFRKVKSGQPCPISYFLKGLLQIDEKLENELLLLAGFLSDCFLFEFSDP